MNSNWRDCDAWRKEKLPMNTSSNEACKLYDVSLSQIVGWYENKQFNGLASSLNALACSDPDFILGHCLKIGVEILGANALIKSSHVYEQIQALKQKAKQFQSTLTKRELLHVKAIELLHQGDLPLAKDYWEQILIENPNDMLAIKFAHSVYFYLGESRQMRDSIARVLPYWNVGMPLYSYLYGMYAFGLAESNQLDEARKNAMIGLELNRNDAWSTHAICHVNEYSSNFEHGIKFLLDSESDWSGCDLISGHNYWHLGLYYLEQQKHDEAFELINTKINKSNKSSLELVNSASLLLRLELDGYRKSLDDWNGLKELYKTRIEDHAYIYSDLHMAIVLGACGTNEEKETYLSSLDKFINSNGLYDVNDQQNDFLNLNDVLVKSTNKNFLKDLNGELSNNLFKSIFYYNQNDFDEVVALLYPIRYKLYKIGGSNAQRDLLNQILIHSALRSNSFTNRRLGVSLLNESLASKPNSNLIQRIMHKFTTPDDFLI